MGGKRVGGCDANGLAERTEYLFRHRRFGRIGRTETSTHELNGRASNDRAGRSALLRGQPEAGGDLGAPACLAGDRIASFEKGRGRRHRPRDDRCSAGHLPGIRGGPAQAVSPQRGDRRRVLRRSGRSDPLGHRRRGGALLRNDDECRRRHRDLLLERFTPAHGRRHPSHEAATRRARRPNPGRARRPLRAKPRDTTHNAPRIAHRSRGPVAPGARSCQLVSGAPRHDGRRLRTRRNGSVPPHYDRARRHRSAAALRHAHQFRQRIHKRRVAGSRKTRRGWRHFPAILRSRRRAGAWSAGRSSHRHHARGVETDASGHRRRRRRPQGRGDTRLSERRSRQRAGHRQVHGGKTLGARGL